MKKTLLLIGTVWDYAVLCFYIVFIKRTFNSLSLSNILMDHGDQGITEFSFLAYNYVDNYTWIIVFLLTIILFLTLALIFKNSNCNVDTKN